MRHLGVSLPALGCCRNEKAVRMIGKLFDQPPLLVRKLGARRAPSCRLLTLAHGGKLQGENPAELVFRVRMGGEEGVGAIDQHAPRFEGLRGKTQHPAQEPLHFLDCLFNNATPLAGLKLRLQFNENPIGSVETPRQDCRDVKKD